MKTTEEILKELGKFMFDYEFTEDITDSQIDGKNYELLP